MRYAAWEALNPVNAMQCTALPHIMVSVFINDDAGLWAGCTTAAVRTPGRPGQVADAHLKRQIMGRVVVVAVTNGQLDFGTWERIFYGEFDGRRRKRVLIKIIGE